MLKHKRILLFTLGLLLVVIAVGCTITLQYTIEIPPKTKLIITVELPDITMAVYIDGAYKGKTEDGLFSIKLVREMSYEVMVIRQVTREHYKKIIYLSKESKYIEIKYPEDFTLY